MKMKKKAHREKAEASFDTSALVSALIAGFQLSALAEIDICNETSTSAAASTCTWEEDTFIIASALSMVLAMLSLVQVTIEYHGVLSNLSLPNVSEEIIKVLFWWGKMARYLNYLNLVTFLFSTAMLIRVRFGATNAVGVRVATFILYTGVGLIFLVILAMNGRKTIAKSGARKALLKMAEQAEESIIRNGKVALGKGSHKRGRPHGSHASFSSRPSSQHERPSSIEVQEKPARLPATPTPTPP